MEQDCIHALQRWRSGKYTNFPSASFPWLLKFAYMFESFDTDTSKDVSL